MATISETGHAKNVANFEDLISFCTGYGTGYNPSRASIQLTALNTLYNDSLAALAAVNNTKATLVSVINFRQAEFNPLRKLATRIVNALDASEASDALVRDAKTIKNKIQGRRATPRKAPAENVSEASQDKQISTSQQSFDSLIEHLEKMIEIISTEPSYTPNETDLTITSLQNLVSKLRASNTAVTNAYTAFSNARIARYNTLYAPTTGLLDIAYDVKNYVKSVFGASSPQYKQVSKIRFTRYRK